jgi:chromate transporter
MTQTVSLPELTRVSARIGLLSFGGPAAQIALMHKELVEDRAWLTEAEFLRALSFCMLLPGPEAMQLATYAGWRIHGIKGGLIAGGLFVIPGACVIFLLAALYAILGAVPLVQALFLGIKATVIVIVLQALWKVAGKALTRPLAWIFAGISFVAIFALALPFPVIVLGAGVAGAVLLVDPAPAPVPLPAHGPGLRVAALGLGLWLVPLALLWATDQTFLFQIGSFFATLAVVTFGGAYAVLAYMVNNTANDRRAWLGRNDARSPNPSYAFGWVSGGARGARLGHGNCCCNADALDDICALFCLDISWRAVFGLHCQSSAIDRCLGGNNGSRRGRDSQFGSLVWSACGIRDAYDP